MSGGVEDLEQDRKIGAVAHSLLLKERKLITDKISNAQAIELAREWADYLAMRGGLWTEPDKYFGRKKVYTWLKYAEGTGNVDEIRKELNSDSEETQKFFIFRAINGHGQFMGGGDRAIERALEKKFGHPEPHSFFEVVYPDGHMDFEKVTCGTCPLARRNYCFIKPKANCYNEHEFEQVAREERKIINELGTLVEKYNIKLR